MEGGDLERGIFQRRDFRLEGFSTPAPKSTLFVYGRDTFNHEIYMKKCIRGEWSKNVVIEYVKWKKSCFANFVMDDISLKKNQTTSQKNWET